MITSTSPAIHTGRWVPTTTGTATNAASPTTDNTAAVAGRSGGVSAIRLRRLARRRGSRAVGTTNSTATRIRKGTAGGTPLKGASVKYLVATDATTPTASPPA